jgi:hypothetical protein
MLEGYRFNWPRETLASQFSFECTRPSWPSRHFMFHDTFNFPLVLTGERRADRARLMRAIHPSRVSSPSSTPGSGRS